MKRFASLFCAGLSFATLPVVATTPATVGVTVYDFDIAAQPLETALVRFSRQSGIVVTASSDVVVGKSTGGVHARSTAEDAMRTLLQGTGLRFIAGPTGSLTIVSPPSDNDVRGAQPAADPDDAERPVANTDASTLSEVIVSSTRRPERLQDIPVSVKVISGERLAEQSQESLVNLTQTLPGVHIVPAGSASFMIVRGIGSLGNQSFDQSVALFSDDVYHGRSRTSVAAFLDLERIEFMKGPQTTDFGANAIAGALNLITRRPGDAFDASARALYGEHGRYALEGAVGGPLGERFGLRVAATYNGTDGWIENINTGTRLPETRNKAGRATFTFTPREAFDATLKIERSEHDEPGAVYVGPQQIVNCPPPAPIPPTFGGITCSQALAGGFPIGLDGNRTAETPGTGNWLDATEYTLTANYRLGESHTLTSVAAYYDYDFDLRFDGDGLPANVGGYNFAPEHGRQFSQELRLTSAPGERFEYLAGLYYQNDDTAYDLQTTLYNVTSNINSTASLAVLRPYLPLARNFDVTQSSKTYSAFADLTWNVTEQLKLGTGLRRSEVRKRTDQSMLYGQGTQVFGGFVPLPAALQAPGGYFGAGIPSSFRGERTDSAWMPSVKVQYRFTPAVMAYTSYDRGFKAGGFNGTDNTGVAANVPFEPEYVDAYEIGVKAEWFDRRLATHLAVFRSEYRDLQVAVTNLNTATGTSVSLVRNAASSLSEGVELEMQWSPTRYFRVTADATYNDAHYVDYPNSAPNLSQQFLGVKIQDLSGQPTVLAPKWSGSIIATVSMPLPAGHLFIAEVSPYITSDYSLHPLTDRQFLWQAGYTRVDARLGLQSADTHWAVDLIGRNITDRVYKIGYAGGYLASKAEPRNVALQVRYQW
jgi:outer membrane receptor protein involved in Fe transport